MFFLGRIEASNKKGKILFRDAIYCYCGAIYFLEFESEILTYYEFEWVLGSQFNPFRTIEEEFFYFDCKFNVTIKHITT